MPHSLVAELGGKLKRYRVFVCFQRDQLLVEYVVAYNSRRTRLLSKCGLRGR